MSKDVAVKLNYAPMVADGADLQAALLENLEGLDINVFDLETVKVPSSGATSWEVVTVDGSESLKELTGVILGTQVARAYWPISFDAGGGSPPTCSSVDGLRGVGDPGGLCATCPYSQFGSDSRQRGQACKQILRVFFLRPGAMLPTLVPLPPTSHKAAKGYLLGLASKGIKARKAATAISLEKDKNQDGIAYSKAKFRLIERLPDGEAAVIDQLAAAILPVLKRQTVSNNEV